MSADEVNINEFQRVKRNLSALVDFSRNVNDRLDIAFTLRNLLLSCFGKFLTSKGFVALSIDGTIKIVESRGIPAQVLDDFPVVPNIIDTENHEKIHDFCEKNGFPVCEMISSQQNILGMLLLGEKITKAPYTSDERDFLKTIINIAATAIQNGIMVNELKSLNKRLDSRINRLSSLFELSKEFGIIHEEERIGKLLLYSLLGHFLTSAYAIVYQEQKELKVLESTASKKVILDIFQNINLYQIKNTLHGDDIVGFSPSLKQFHFEIIVPMIVFQETKGLIILGNKANKEPYSADDMEFISSLAAIAIISLENKRLFKEELEKQRLEEELEIAKKIQMNLLPKKIPEFPEMKLEAFSLPSRQVGGDYYDIIPLPDEKWCIAIGDVSGKGVPASLLMANLQAFLKSICKQNLPITDATGLINDLVSENTSDGRFITFFWGYLDVANKMFQYVNAGHNPPLLIRDNKVQYLDKGGMILGVMKTMLPYQYEEISLQKDDLVVMFTDGITEAKNSKDEEFSDNRLESFLLQNTDFTAAEISKKIRDEVQSFVQQHPQSDDITLIVLKVD